MARVSSILSLILPAVSHLSVIVFSVETSSASRSATPLAPTLLISANIYTTVSDAPTMPPTTPKMVPSSRARVTTRTIPASTRIPPVRSRPTLSLPSRWVPSPPCHTSPRSPLLPIVSLTPRPPSTPLFPPSVTPIPRRVLAPLLSSPPVPGPPPDLPTLPQVTAVIMAPPMSRLDPSFSHWVSVLSVLSLPSSLWPEFSQ